MYLRPVALALLAAAGLGACIPGLPSNPSAPPLSATGFSDADPTPEPAAVPAPAASPTPAAGPAATPTPPVVSDGSPFSDPRFQDVSTSTKFQPKFFFSFDEIRAGAEPGVALDVYQTKAELEVREVRILLERTRFHYEKLRVGLEVGDGHMDIGTPPKLGLDVKVVCTETDGATYGVFSVKGEGPLVSVYLADVRIKDNDGNLSVVSIGNLARANDRDGRHTTEASARVIQKFYPGYVILPPDPGTMRMRQLIYSETDPAGGGTALRVIHQTLGLQP
jgi:hypothetical protein